MLVHSLEEELNSQAQDDDNAHLIGEFHKIDAITGFSDASFAPRERHFTRCFLFVLGWRPSNVDNGSTADSCPEHV